ncbi:MAG: hypothetical protein NTW96_05520 [Planctomycetia bacterium]|nr:hypothetical protein [Planctomycetia bacterium]
MNVTSTLLLVVLSGGGYWFGGRVETAQVQWDVKQPLEAATVTWRLVCGDASLASGQIVLPAEDRMGKVRLSLPEVRVPTEMRFVYRAARAGQAKAIAEGAVAVHVYPNNLLASVAERMKTKQLFVWDEAEGLPAVLKSEGVQFAHVRSEADLQFVRPDLLIVGADRLGKATAGQDKLLNLAAAGTSVLVLRQSQLAKLAGYPVARRVLPPKLVWRVDHPLARHLGLFETPSLGPDGWAIRLPADEPALEIGWWPSESPSRKPVPIDALVVAKALGRGRIVLCQVPLGPWETDPRSQSFLVDALDYLASPVVPTPPPSRRPRPDEPAPAPNVPSIVLP